MKCLKSICILLLSLLVVACGAENPPLKVRVDERAIGAEEGKPPVSYADVLEEATPSVVAVYTSRIVRSRGRQQLPDYLRGFGFPQPRGEEGGLSREQKQPLGVGSGVVISEDGYIVTNHHVVQGEFRGEAADEITVLLNDEREYSATLIGSDSKTDVAVLKIEPDRPLTAMTLADSELLRVGDVVFAIGNPLDVGLTATQGIVSATGRSQGGRVLGHGSYEDFIQTDAAINLGNSGGALIDAWGRLVGINTAIVSGTGGSIGIGFAIPANLVMNVASNLIKSGAVPRGMLGLYPDDLSRDMADAFGLATTKGALVNQVLEGSPAEAAGIFHGDIITKIGDKEIDSASDLRLTVSQILPGTSVEVVLIRQGEILSLPVVLGSLDGKAMGGPSPSSPLEGVTFQQMDSSLRADWSIPEDVDGVLIEKISIDSPYSEKLVGGMVVIEVNGVSVSGEEEISEELRDGQNRFYVWFEGAKRFVVFKH